MLDTELPHCRLRPWRDGDQAALVQQANNRQVWRNLTSLFPHPYTLADAEGWIILAQAPGRSLHLCIEMHGQVAGGIGAIAREGIACATADFGYWLGQAHWGQGLATAAARAMAQHLLGSGQFARLEAPVFAWNPASMRVLEKAGFQREGLLRHSVSKDGQLIDSVLYARLAQEDSERPAAPDPGLQAVVYAQSLPRLAAFYSRVCGLAQVASGEGFVSLWSAGLTLTVVQVPEPWPLAPDPAQPAPAREDVPLKLSFPVPRLDLARAEVVRQGGMLKPQASAWAWRGWLHLDGVDPECNVFQLREALNPSART